MQQQQVGESARRTYMSMREKEGLILATLRAAAEPLTKKQLCSASGLTLGQITPALGVMLREGTIVQTKESTSKFQRYALA